MSTVSRQQYASLYGPTVGDRFRLADTELIAEVERSLLRPGEEAVYGGGKSLRDGMGQVPGLRNAEGALDLVITSGSRTGASSASARRATRSYRTVWTPT
jgi:urease subunit alpha